MHMDLKKYFFTVVLFFLFFKNMEAQNTTKLSAISIDSKNVIKHLQTIASDKMQGRKVGTSGIELAATYIENEFLKLGLTTFNKAKNYRQNFERFGIKLSNIVGVLEGSTKKEEWIMISAHYDHLGILKPVDGDSIANGADDDASGVAAVLALAEYWTKKRGNKRTIVFAAFSGEEKGLWGSTYFGTQVEPKKCVAGINIEMIGKDSKFGPNSAFLTGYEKSNLGKIMQKNLKGTAYKLHPDPYKSFKLFYRSDNASLARLGVPAHTFSTCPIDKDRYYHTVNDELETLNSKSLTNTIQAIALGIESIINANDTPTRVDIEFLNN
jgi:Zn-dependent M28 family amino/carboxypeptidase